MKAVKLATLLWSSAISCTTVAWAQEAPPADPGAQAPQDSSEWLQDIIVTAQKRSEKLSDVPLSITAATGDQLTKQGITTPADLTKIVPGFTFIRSPYAAPIYQIRGIGTYDEAVAVAPTVSIYIDQVPLPYSRMTEGLTLDLERVEVLKGPQGTLFGQNSTGGAINYIAAKPTDDFHIGGNATLGRFDQVDLEGYVSGPLTEGVKARVAIRSEQRGDWQKSQTSTDTLGSRDFLTGRLLLDVQPSDALSLEFSASGWKDDSDTQAKQYRGWFPDDPSSARYHDAPGFPNWEQDLRNFPQPPHNARIADWNRNTDFRHNDHFYQFSLRGDLSLSDAVTLTSITSYANLHANTLTDYDGTPFPDEGVLIRGRIKSFSQELRLAGSVGNSNELHWMIGGNYQDDITKDSQITHLNGSNIGVGPYRFSDLRLINDQDIKTKAAFGSLDYKLTETLTVQASARYTENKRDFSGCLADPGNGAFGQAFGFLSELLTGTEVDGLPPLPGSPSYIAPGACTTLDQAAGRENLPVTIVTNRLKQHNTSWRAGVSWKPDGNLMIYGNVTQGFKAGGFGTLTLIRPGQSKPVVQEKVLAYELGFKSSLIDRAVDLSGAAFYYDYTDKQLLGSIYLGPPFGSLPALINVPKTRVAGAELDATFRPTRNTTFRIGGTYVDSRVLKHPILIDRYDGFNFDGHGAAFPNTPRWQLTSDLEQYFPAASDWDAFVGGTVTYRSDTQTFFGGNRVISTADGITVDETGKKDDNRLPGYALVDLRAGIASANGTYRLQFWGRNVFNKFYKIYGARNHDTITWLTGMPVTYGVTLTTKF